MHSPVSQSSNFSVSSNRRLPWNGLLLVVVSLVWLTICPFVQAVTPAPDGGYPKGNTAEGTEALFSLDIGRGDTGTDNTAIGYFALHTLKLGIGNTATGGKALYSTFGGSYNTANGYGTLYNNSYGDYNTANGFKALLSNKGSYNTAIGSYALQANTGGGPGVNNGNLNTATGFNALCSNTTGGLNTATGENALYGNTTGFGNTASGSRALHNNTSGNDNTAIGNIALFSNTDGYQNVACGIRALYNNTTGLHNTALGDGAGSELTTGSNNIDIGNVGVAGESNTMRFGVSQTATFIAGVRGATTVNANAIPVVVDSAGQLGTVSSSRRFKDEIKPMDNSSEAIFGLKPVTFHYKSDNNGTPQFGLIAEEVAKVNPDLVVRDDNGEIYTVRYEAVNAMLLNEFLKEHRNVAEQQRTIADLKTTVVQQQKQIEALTTGLQKVTTQVESNQTAPRVVSDN